MRPRSSFLPLPRVLFHDSGTPRPGMPRIAPVDTETRRLKGIEACCDSMRRYTRWIQEEQAEPEPDMAYILGRQLDRRVAFNRLRLLRRG